MFSTTIYIALAGILLSAPSAFAVPGLSLHISGPKTVEGIENLKLVATVNNTGDETLKLLNDPRGLLSTMPTRKFIIRNAAGEEPLFTGAMVKYVPADHAAVAKDKEDFTVLAPGESVSVEHDCTSSLDPERGAA
jgi:peptidyl-Lys metalloendopeptidase